MPSQLGEARVFQEYVRTLLAWDLECTVYIHLGGAYNVLYIYYDNRQF